MDNVIKWVTTQKDKREYNRAPAWRLNQFEKDGYRIQQHDEEMFMIERLKSTRAVYTNSIGSAEQVVKAALEMENTNDTPSGYLTSILDKAAMLIGKIDIMYSSRNGDKNRRRY